MAEFSAVASVLVALVLGLVPFLLFGGYAHAKLLYSKGNGKAKVPRGSPWILPFMGETVEFVRSTPGTFFEKHFVKYGGLYTTHLFGSPTVIAETPEAQKFFLSSKAFELKLTPNFQRIFGKYGIGQLEAEEHRRMRSLMLSVVGHNSLAALVAPVDKMAIDFFEGFQDGTTINAVKDLVTFTFSITSIVVSDYLEPGHARTKRLEHLMHILAEGWTTADQIGLPGSPFRKALKARKEAMEMFDAMFKERRRTGGQHSDIVQAFLDTEKTDKPLSDIEMKDNVMSFIFGSYHTTSVAMAWLLKYLYLNPQVMQQVVEEQDRLAASKAPGELLTPEDLKSMKLSFRVILETLRLATFVPFTMREAMQDVEFDGHFIPKGWKVIVNLRHPHYISENYPDPLKFDPSRFETTPKPGSYLPFGGGTRLCIGNEFVKQEMLILMHRFFTKFSYKPVGPDLGTKYLPLSLPKGGYPITIYRRS